mmetsp:Transcript_5461/g.8825  ORF Transcript_5461/g.8825 Transcript_5461/m.8825 type:complete len:208 (-) Transcript_5461:122-745(-)
MCWAEKLETRLVMHVMTLRLFPVIHVTQHVCLIHCRGPRRTPLVPHQCPRAAARHKLEEARHFCLGGECARVCVCRCVCVCTPTLLADGGSFATCDPLERACSVHEAPPLLVQRSVRASIPCRPCVPCERVGIAQQSDVFEGIHRRGKLFGERALPHSHLCLALGDGWCYCWCYRRFAGFQLARGMLHLGGMQLHVARGVHLEAPRS